jgi:hypothetical protein
MCSGESDWTCLQPGFPIRKSSDHSLVIDSPRLIADSYVLHRFLVPRHPPCALKNLSHKDARVHCVVLKKRAAPHPTRRLPHHPRQGLGMAVRPRARVQSRIPTARRCQLSPDPSGPNNVPGTTCPPPAFHDPPQRGEPVLTRQPDSRRQLIDVPPLSTRCPTLGDRPGSGSLARPALLRKEVIQPHLPVRLPCYDLVPIASPTFDGSPPQGVGPPASGVTDFRDLTGGVYKARERIHRSVADLRLLATPTSWGRVADPNPN